jgi:hypothetical protein
MTEPKGRLYGKNHVSFQSRFLFKETNHISWRATRYNIMITKVKSASGVVVLCNAKFTFWKRCISQLNMAIWKPQEIINCPTSPVRTAVMLTYTAIPVQAWTGPWGSRRLRLPKFLDSRHTKVVRLSALRTGCPYPPGDISGTHFCLRLSQPPGHSASGRIKWMKSHDPFSARSKHYQDEWVANGTIFVTKFY